MIARWPYADLLELPHHVSVRRPRMSVRERAAQFAPFAALSGYGASVQSASQRMADAYRPDGSRWDGWL